MKREKVSLPFIGISLNGNGTWKKARLIERAVFLKKKTYRWKVCKQETSLHSFFGFIHTFIRY